MKKYNLKVSVCILCLLCFLTACAQKAEDPNPSTNTSSITGNNEVQNVGTVPEDNAQKDGVLPERDPNAEYIQNYRISALKSSSSTDYTDSQYFWVKLLAKENSSKIQTDSWAAIDETGKIYGIVPLENTSDEVEYFKEFICVEETRLYKYDGSEVTQQYLSNGETLLRITKCKDGFAIWKYQTDKKYQEEKIYTLRVCNTNGDLLFEIDSSEYKSTDGLCRCIQNGESPAFAKLSNSLYYVQNCNIVDLSTGKMFDIEQYDAVQKLTQNASKWKYNWVNSLSAIENVLFVPTGDNVTYAYKLGENKPLYSVNTITKVSATRVEARFLNASSDAWILCDIYTGKQIYTLQNSLTSTTYNKIQYSTKYDAYIEQVGDFVGVFSMDGIPCFEPIEGKLIANWLDYNGNLLIKYTGHAYDGAGLYVVDMEGKMTMLSITGSGFALTAQNRVIVFDGGTYKLYDEDWNQLC